MLARWFVGVADSLVDVACSMLERLPRPTLLDPRSRLGWRL
jgi:hypothetical protein